MTDINQIRASILSRIKPSEAEKARLVALAESIIVRVNSIAGQEGISASAQLVGSSARGTWISGEHDLDIFIMFSPSVERKELEEKGLYIARKVAQVSQSFEERYAEHPYIHALFDGFEVDLVPAFNVERASDIKSAVDRTPFHNIYVASMIKGLEDEVLLLKQFMKGIGVYGSELKTHGFSGYLVELLIIHYGSFIKVLESSCEWKPDITIDIEKHGGTLHKDPLVVVDATDPARNVAAALSLDNLCIFIDKACKFLENPDEAYFTGQVPEPLGDNEFKKILAERGTSLIAIEFAAPDVVEDVLFPQLHKLEESVREMFDRYDFRVYNSSVWAKDKAIALFELETASLPQVKKHTGPFVWSKEHASAFKSKYKDSNTFSNVFIQNGKYMVEIPRKYTSAKKLIESGILNCGLGKHVALSIKKEFHVLEDNELLNIRDVGFRRFLRRFFEK
ncbi:MAG: CCA tRNA nucleotidyltransferase [Euryarchaeota archaeon]|nr:CCA tRNA nucleotidyltransferase [Euryarchaeota archaeon]MBU4491366.1 CCA tRNA nucleotidyltransferase [Euryarchaeota archaeon]MCG2728624.1 CCA tRNA nucleotidyltransferase [Candidatus Methanoperedenaceae archaeon]